MLCAEMPANLVWNGAIFDRHANELLLGMFDGLGNGFGNLRRFAFADPDPPLLITHNHQRGEIKPLSTFHHFGHTVDKNDLVFQI